MRHSKTVIAPDPFPPFKPYLHLKYLSPFLIRVRSGEKYNCPPGCLFLSFNSYIICWKRGNTILFNDRFKIKKNVHRKN